MPGDTTNNPFDPKQFFVRPADYAGAEMPNVDASVTENAKLYIQLPSGGSLVIDQHFVDNLKARLENMQEAVRTLQTDIADMESIVTTLSPTR